MLDEKDNSYPIDEVLQKKPWHLAEAYRYCQRVAAKHYENFPVASILIPKKLRPHIAAIYAFARRADDIADEDFPEDERFPALEAWQLLLEKSRQTRVNHPVFIALSETLQKFNISNQLLIDLITAFKIDVKIKRYANFADLLLYCRYSANPVGRLVLKIFGYQDEGLMKLSDYICTALQLANFWQDVSVDLLKNRIYIPQEDMQRFAYSEAQLFASEYNPDFQKLMQFQIERTARLFHEGAPLVHQVQGRLSLELKCVILGGLAILKKIEAMGGNTLAARPHLAKNDKLKLAYQGLFRFRAALRQSDKISSSPLSSASASEEAP